LRFIDEVEITCVSGRGGDGSLSFRREPYTPRGGPDGGDGGRGGNVVLVATRRLNTLYHLRGTRLYPAKDGGGGGAKNMTGRNGKDRVIEVPVGTVIRDMDEGVQVADLAEEGRVAVVCRGGRGGRGNSHFKSSTNRTPRQVEHGGAAIERRLGLELKLLADVGLLGFPNAGKSTLISRISRAKPKVADYPFTTLVPNLGVVSPGGEESFVVADIPGLVAGASEGIGLGHRFLRHVERCSFLLHMVSAMEIGEAVEDPLERYEALVRELAAFSEKLASRTQIPVLTKVDLLTDEELAPLLQRFEEQIGMRPWCISSVSGQGIDALVGECARRLRSMLEVDEE
jgi:GTP-binding protein